MTIIIALYIDKQTVRYMTAVPGTFPGFKDDRTSEAKLLDSLLPEFPPGDQNSHIARGLITNKPAFVKKEKVSYLRVLHMWHSTRLMKWISELCFECWW